MKEIREEIEQETRKKVAAEDAIRVQRERAIQKQQILNEGDQSSAIPTHMIGERDGQRQFQADN
jgi:hypothetical protein